MASLSSKQAHISYEFGAFRLTPSEGQLLREGLPLPLPPKAFEMLVLLVRQSGHLISKEELMQTLWPDSFVEEANLTHHIWMLRKTLAEAENGHRYIETVPRRGYRFVADVRESLDEGDELVLEKHTLTHIVTREREQEALLEEETMGAAPRNLPLATHRRIMSSFVIVIVGALLVVGGLLLRRWNVSETKNPVAAVSAKPFPRSIAVLPFTTIGATNDQAYLGLGMTDALITKLANIHQLAVRPTSAVRRYTTSESDPIAAGREQGVDAVLAGSVQQTGDRIRVTVQLFRVDDRTLLWSGKFDESLTDIFTVQDSISQQVIQGLLVGLSDAERKQFQKHGTGSFDAYQAYLKGRYFWNKRNQQGFEEAIKYFNQAVAKDPNFAEAYAGLSDTYQFVGAYSVASRTELLAKSRAAARRALDLDESLAEPHASLGLMAQNYDWDWSTAEREYKRAIELNPNYATAHQWYAGYLVAKGKFDEGLAEIHRAHELDPLSLIIDTDTGSLLFLARKYDEAILQLKKTLEMDPNYGQALNWLGWVYEWKGLHDQAAATFERMQSTDTSVEPLAGLGYIYAARGKRNEALNMLNKLNRLSRQKPVDPCFILDIYLGLGQTEDTFAWLEKEYDVRSVGQITLKVNPFYDNLRSDPRFKDLIRRVGFDQ